MVTDSPPSTIRGVNETFYAIADPTRRSILDLVRRQERSAGEIAQCFPVSRPAIAKHVRVLKQAGLLRERRQSTLRLYSIDAGALQRVDEWLAPYRLYWSARLLDLKRVVEDDLAGHAASRRPRVAKKKR
jgi:DNA-binding transcriptional ArsR family regulator